MGQGSNLAKNPVLSVIQKHNSCSVTLEKQTFLRVKYYVIERDFPMKSAHPFLNSLYTEFVELFRTYFSYFPSNSALFSPAATLADPASHSWCYREVGNVVAKQLDAAP